ncbi:MAG: beta-glucosidase [Chloroflexi bacterium]|nr:beta-glucosidase [Chloroflexota bacterium]
MSDLQFPDGFLWGTATASFQIEGGRKERGDSIWDDFCAWPGKVVDGDTGDVADDHYHRYQQDVDLLKAFNANTYRFSISWPRVLPQGTGEVNHVGLDFYSRLVDALLAAGIEPFITLYHWDLPSALQRLGGWVNRDTVYRYVDYAEIVAKKLGDRVRYWITHNEPWVAAILGHHEGVHAPGWTDHSLALQVGHHLLLSHGLAMPLLHQLTKAGSRLGITLNLSQVYAASDKTEDIEAAKRYDGHLNRWYLDPVLLGNYPQDIWQQLGWRVPRIAPQDMDIIGTPIDFLGINNYSRAVIGHSDEGENHIQSIRPKGEYTAMDWEVYPQGIKALLVRVTREYGAPDLYVTENGCAYEDTISDDGQVHDPQRVDFFRRYLKACHEAITEGVQLKGYLAWSLLDNFEWSFGYSRRFGITYVDYATQERIPKDSAKFLSEVFRSNSLPQEA